MIWEAQFDEESLKQGWQLYQQGRVQKIQKIKNSVKAKCRDGYQYPMVTITIENAKYHAECECWDYHAKKSCRHTAAVLYAVTCPQELVSAAGKSRIMPFGRKKDSDQEYHYFDIRKITENIIVMEHRYQKALQLIEGKGILGTEIGTYTYRDENDRKYVGLNCDVSFPGVDQKRVQHAAVRVGKNFTWSASCGCHRCYCSFSYQEINQREKPELCEHLLVAMIELEKYIQRENPGDETDHQGKLFLGRFRRKQNAVSEKTATVFLEPELQSEDGELKAAFRIGIEKSYKVKNLTELVSVVENDETLGLGKTNAIPFSQYEFDEKSKPIFEFIRNKVRDNQQRRERMEARRYWGYGSAGIEEPISSSIYLEGSSLDEFYQLCSGFSDIPVTYKSYRNGTSKSKVSCSEGTPEIKLSLRELRDGRQTAGIAVMGSIPELNQGAQGVYFLNDKHFCRASQDTYEKLQPLLELRKPDGTITFQVGRRYLGDFYRNVYPVLKQVANLDDRATGKIQKLLPPAAEVTFYLDSESNVLNCKTVVSYGEQQHSPFDVKTVRQLPQLYRDYEKEKEICRTVETYFPEYHAETELSLCEDPEACYRVYREGVDALLLLGEVRCTEGFQSRRVRKSVGVKVGISVESDLLNLDVSTAELSRQELSELFDSYRKKKKYHVLRNGDFVDLEAPDMELINQILSTCRADLKALIGDKLQVPLYRALYLDRLLESHEELYSHRDRSFRNLIKEFGTIRDSDFEVPVSLENILRSYQVFGHKWLRTILHNGFGGILADEMGLGKTLQMISVLLAEKGEIPKTALVVCPASLVYNWKEEFRRFAPQLKVVTVAGSIKERRSQIHEYQEYDVLITSYDLLKRDIAEYQDCTLEYQILDEAQYIKNARTAASKSVKAILAKHRFALTGTPIENRLSELWNLFDFLMPGFLHDYETFRKELETPILKEQDEACSQRLKQMIAPFILRRLKTDVLHDLPDKIEELRYAVMEDTQRKLYDAQILQISNQVSREDQQEFQKDRFRILAEITRARQLCCDPSLVLEQYRGGSAKREACMELIQSAIEGEHRILLFSQFTSMLELLEHDLKASEISYYKLTGSTPKEERVQLMKQFNEGNVPVFLISLKAGGTGLNLTGADVVIHYDPWWNLAAQNQATDRAHRIGQTQTVTVYKLIIKDSIEEKIVKLQGTKRDLAEAVLSGENGTLGSMSREELIELLS